MYLEWQVLRRVRTPLVRRPPCLATTRSVALRTTGAQDEYALEASPIAMPSTQRSAQSASSPPALERAALSTYHFAPSVSTS